jgi:predicted KAP-like P-loop ATPase
MYHKTVEVVDGINYLGVTLENTREWNKHKYKANLKAKWNHTLVVAVT